MYITYASKLLWSVHFKQPVLVCHQAECGVGSCASFCTSDNGQGCEPVTGGQYVMSIIVQDIETHFAMYDRVSSSG